MNGTPVKNLEGLVAAVEGCKEHFLQFQLEYNQVLLQKITLSQSMPEPDTCRQSSAPLPRHEPQRHALQRKRSRSRHCADQTV